MVYTKQLFGTVRELLRILQLLRGPAVVFEDFEILPSKFTL